MEQSLERSLPKTEKRHPQSPEGAVHEIKGLFPSHDTWMQLFRVMKLKCLQIGNMM